MSDLIESLQILAQYMEDKKWPTHCEHDVMLVACETPPKDMQDEHAARLRTLGWNWGEVDATGGDLCWYSFRFGSC